MDMEHKRIERLVVSAESEDYGNLIYGNDFEGDSVPISELAKGGRRDLVEAIAIVANEYLN